MSSPPTEPPPHVHQGKVCPVSGKGHAWCPAQKGDSRSVCPALNTLANHGYIARNGKNLGVFDFIFGLRACYNLSFPLATFLSLGGFFLLKRIHKIDLFHIGKHGAVEHNASLVHEDTPQNEEFAPTAIQPGLVQQLIQDAKTGDEEAEGEQAGNRRILMDASDVARARVRREKSSPVLDGLHAEIARGEMAIILGVWETKAGNNIGVPVEWMREWIWHERLPSGWKPTHVQGLFDVVKRAKAIRSAMELQKKAQ